MPIKPQETQNESTKTYDTTAYLMHRIQMETYHKEAIYSNFYQND